MTEAVASPEATAPRAAQNVVTSENLAAWNAQRLGVADAAPTEAGADPEPAAQDGQSESDDTNTSQQQERKPNPKIEKRFSDLTRQREEARKDAERERVKREELEARVRELEGKAAPKEAPAEPNEKPRAEQFKDAFEYAEALAEWSAEQAIANREKAEAERKAAEQRDATMRQWADRVKSVRDELPDFDDMIGSSDVSVSDQVRDAILESDVGPRILYHLAENPEVATKLASLSTVSALREIGKMEARFEKAATPTESTPETRPAARASRAPAPISPIRATTGAMDNNLDSDGQFHGTYAQWKAARMAKKIR